MGKASRRYRREKQQKQQAQAVQQNAQEKKALEAQMREKIEAEAYGDALNVLAEMIEKKIYEPEDMYQGAYCYFMTGDYERAVSWLDNTLKFAPNHVEARLLLARICILEDRTQDGMAIYDFILEHYAEALQPEQREDMQDILEYYAQEDPERIRREFPYVAAFMHLAGEAEPAMPGAPEQPIAVETEKETAAEPEPAPKAEPGPKQEPPAFDAAAKIAEVMQSKVSVAERIHLLNSFAGRYYVAGDHEGAKACLTAALQLDDHDDETLRNLAVLSQAMGDPDKALQFAAAMSYTDFVLLTTLKG